MCFIIQFLTTVLVSVQLCESANVLIALPAVLSSHYINIRPLGLELARRGHKVTVITAIKENNPPENYTEVFTEFEPHNGDSDKTEPNSRFNIFKFGDKPVTAQHDHYRTVSLNFTETSLKSSALQQFLKIEHDFDLVITEQFYSEACNYLSLKYNCPLVLFASFGNCMKQNIAVGNPLQLRMLYSEYLRIYDYGFWSKFQNIYITLYEYINWAYFYLPKQESIAKKYLGLQEDVPSLLSVQKNAALFLMNRYPVLDPPAAYLPNFIEISGMHLNTDEEVITDDLKTILDNAPGIVYVNLGTNIPLSDMPEKKRDVLFNVLRRLNETVILKTDLPLKGLAKNIVSRNWLPQRKILAHPKTKLFITHGGLNSIQETIYYGVPIIGIPVYGDQHRNLLNSQKLGFASIVLYHDFEEKLEITVTEHLKNDSYENRAKKLSLLYRDRPRKALDTAVSMIEHVIEHGIIADNIANEMDWVEFYTIDLYAIFLAIVAIAVLVMFKIVMIAKKCVFCIKSKLKQL